MCSDLNYFWPSPRFWYLNSVCSSTLFASLFFTTVSSWLCDSQTCLSVNHWHSIRDSESKSSTLRSNDATSTRTPLKKWICVDFLSLYRNCSYSLTLSNPGEPSWSWIPRNHIQVQKQKSISSLLVYVVHKGDVTYTRRFATTIFATTQRCNVGKMW